MKVLFIGSNILSDKNATVKHERRLYSMLRNKLGANLAVIVRTDEASPENLDSQMVKSYSNSYRGSYVTEISRESFLSELPRSRFLSLFKVNYTMGYPDSLYDLINSENYDVVISSYYLLDKSHIRSNSCRIIYLAHDTMYGLVREGSSLPEQDLKFIKEFELDLVSSRADQVFTVSQMDADYFGEVIKSDYLPEVCENVNEYQYNNITGNSSIEYDLFFGGNSTWFRTYESLSKLVTILDNSDLSAFVYIPGLISKDRVPERSRLTLSTKRKFDEDNHTQSAFSIIPHEYLSGFPTKLTIGLSNGLPVLTSCDPRKYIGYEYDDGLCEVVIPYNNIDDIRTALCKYDVSVKRQCIDLIRKFRSEDVVHRRLLSIL